MVFGGKQILKPEALQEMDTDVSGVIEMKNYKETLSRTRDVIKKIAYGVEFVVMGIESQQHIHYAMPLRNMIYDAMGYLKEYQEITRSYKSGRPQKTRDEFLSKLKKGSKLHPVITLTIYYGERAWDGPYCLRDMVGEMPEEMQSVFSDYKMNLLEIRDSGKFAFQNEDIQTVFEITREAFAGHFDRIREKYGSKKLTSELLTVIGKMAGSGEIMDMGSNEGVDNMCTALEKLKQQGIEQGIERGIEQERKSRICAMMCKGYPLSEISAIFDISEQEVLRIKNENEDLKAVHQQLH